MAVQAGVDTINCTAASEIASEDLSFTWRFNTTQYHIVKGYGKRRYTTFQMNFQKDEDIICEILKTTRPSFRVPVNTPNPSNREYLVCNKMMEKKEWFTSRPVDCSEKTGEKFHCPIDSIIEHDIHIQIIS